MHQRFVSSVVICLIPALISAGCAHYRLEKVRFPASDTSSAGYYQTPRLSGSVKRHVIKRSRHFSVQKVVLPAGPLAIDRAPVGLEFYLPGSDGPVPLILISPILGGKYRIERSLAEYLAKHGFAALIVHRKSLRLLPDEGVQQLEDYLRASVIRLRRALDWAQTQKEIDKEKIGTLGISLGGILNVVLAGVDKRVKAHVIAMAGGNLADVVCYTHEKAVKRYRNQFMKRQGLTLDELREQLRATIVTDPMSHAHEVGTDNALLFIAWFDMIIGRKYSRKLAKALGNPETYYFPLGHYSSLLTIPFVRVRALRFFEKKFKTIPQAESARNWSWRQARSLPRKRPKTPDRRTRRPEEYQEKPLLVQLAGRSPG